MAQWNMLYDMYERRLKLSCLTLPCPPTSA